MTVTFDRSDKGTVPLSVRANVTVIFDGREHDTEPAPTVEVAFAPHADDAIAARAAPGVRVVTSDRGLAERVRAAGGEVEPAKAFRDGLGA